MRLNAIRLALLLVYIVSLVALLGAGTGQTSNPPPISNQYDGQVFIADEPAEDGIEIFARILDYQSNIPREGFDVAQVVQVSGERYERMIVSPSDVSFVGEKITFHATFGFGDVQAEETAVFRQVNLVTGEWLNNTLDLHFQEAPPAAPMPTPTPTPTITPTPLPTPVLPIPGDPSVTQIPRIALIAGMIALVAGGSILFLVRRRNAV